MTSVAALLTECASRGISLRAGAAGKLVIGGRQTALTAAFIDQVRANKDALLRLVADLGAKANSHGVGCPIRAWRKEALSESSNSTGPLRGACGTCRCSTGQTDSRRLIGNVFAPIPPTSPPVEVWEAPIVLCPVCRRARVLTELRQMTAGRCYSCWLASAMENSASLT